MSSLVLSMFLTDLLKIIAFIIICGVVSGFIPMVGTWMKATVSFFFNVGVLLPKKIMASKKKMEKEEKE